VPFSRGPGGLPPTSSRWKLACPVERVEHVEQFGDGQADADRRSTTNPVAVAITGV
jgi:hypothetical protein